MEKYCARICWNSHGWVFPSGEAKELETESYVTKAGFGHEEWLLNFAWLIGGYHYGFLQPVSDSYEKVNGKTIDVLLFTINPKGDRVYVGEISRCEVITHEQAQSALEDYKKAGWHNSMKQQVRDAGGDAARLTDAPDQFNIRFKPDEVELYDPLRVAAPTDFVSKLNRYKLVKAGQPQVVVQQWRRRRGAKVPPSLQTITRRGQPSVTYDPIHAAMQGQLQKALAGRYGKDNVILEADYVDITVKRSGNKRTLIEIKSDPDARLAIRKALGQILEYAFRLTATSQASVELAIVAPGQMTTEVANHLQFLKSRFGLKLTYCSYSLGDPLPSAFR